MGIKGRFLRKFLVANTADEGSARETVNRRAVHETEVLTYISGV